MSYKRDDRRSSYRRNSPRSNMGHGHDGRRTFNKKPPQQKRYEDYAWILDFLPNGRTLDEKRPKLHGQPLLQVIGEKYFSLLEVLLDKNQADKLDFDIGSRIYIGKGDKNAISHRFRRIRYDQLTMNAKAELPGVLEKIVKQNQKRLLDFFNKSQPITNRMHQL